MALPTLELTWQYNVNLTCSAGVNGPYTYKQIWYNIKDAMTTFASNPWTVVSSSDGSVADTNDNWTSTGSLNWGNGGTRSWIVLKQTGVSSNFQVCFELDATGYGGESTGRSRVVISNADGFTGGSTSARPTATDEFVIWDVTSGAFPFSDAGPFQAVVHVQQSTDGSATRAFVMYNGECQGWLMFQKATDTPAAWSPANVFVAQSSNNSNASVQLHGNYNQAANIGARITGTNLALYLTGEGYGDGTVGESAVKNELDNNWPMLPMGLFHATTVGKRGRHGRLKDIWWGATSAPPAFAGATYPEDGSKQFIQFGHMIFPWNGSTPIIG